MKARMIEFIMMIRAGTDITERKRGEEELRAPKKCNLTNKVHVVKDEAMASDP